MKKFLFTLAALLMASSAFAKSYLYVNDFEVPASYIGTGEEYEMIVSAHFEECVSAWDVYFTFPEGMTCTGVDQGADWAIATYNNRGKAINYAPPLYGAVAPFNHLITASAEAGYNEDKTTYGSIKWWAGEYEEYLIMYFTFDENFKGGTVEIKTEPSCSGDNREGFVPANNNADNSAPAPTIVTVEETAQPAPEPTFRVEDGKVYAEAAGHELSEVKLFRVLLDEDGQEMSRVPLGNPFTLPAAIFDEDQVFNFVAYTVANENESANSAEVPYQYTVKKKEDAMPAQPTISFEPEEDGTVTVVAYLMYYGQAPYTEYVDLYLKNAEGEWEKVDNPYTGLPSVNNSYTEDILYEFMAISRADGEQYNKDGYPEYKNYSLPHLTKKTCESPSIMIIDRTDDAYTIGIFPDENTDGELEWTANPMPGRSENLVYTRGDTEYQVTVRARTKEGATYQASEWAEETFTIPAKPAPEVTKTPSVTYSYENGKLNVWAYGSDDDAVYTLYCDGEKFTGEMPISYDIYAGYGPHTWTATAIAPNKTVSKVSDPVEITIAKEPKVYEADAPVISDPVITDDAYTYTVTGDGTIEVKVTTYDEEGNPVVTTTTGEKSVTVVIPRTDETQYVNIVATNTPAVPEGYDSVLPGQDSKMYEEIEAKPEVPVTAAPDATFDEGVSTYVYLYDENNNLIIAPDGKPAVAVDENGKRIIDENGHWKSISFVNMDEDAAVIEYSLDGGETWYTWDNKPIVFSDNGQYVVLARATANGKETSDVAEFVVVVTPATSVNELVNGKTVAGVRYFNMAGQEMQEANGITIVVTTYTDGTTSAVKVIK